MAFMGHAQTLINGLYYKFNSDDKTAEVCYRKDDCEGVNPDITIPSKVSHNRITHKVIRVGDMSFCGCHVNTVVIPNTVTSIGDCAFYFSSLQSVTIPGSVTSIERCAFDGCSGLKNVTLPDHLTFLGANAFSSTGITSVVIPGSLTSIGDNAFAYCGKMTSVTIPSSVASIGGGAFESDENLTAVNISDLEAWCRLSFFDDRANPLKYAHHLYLNGAEVTDLVVPGTMSAVLPFSFIGGAFTSVTIPDCIVNIGNEAFRGCSEMTSLTLPARQVDIGGKAFAGCSALAALVVPEGMTDISEEAFCQMEGLTTLTLPQSLTTIGKSAFSGCSSLVSVAIPDGVINIGESAFSGCGGMTSLQIGGQVSQIGSDAFGECGRLRKVTVKCKVPPSISPSTFPNRSNETLVVPKGCKSAYEDADYWWEFKEIVEEGATNILKGDMNDDGVISVTDVVLLVKLIVGGQ